MQRRQFQRVAGGEVVAISGDWFTIDRQGNPLVNNTLVPGPRKNEYNGATTMDDASGRFRDDLVQSLRNFGVTNQASINRLMEIVVNRGDFLRLNLGIPNSGTEGGTNAGGGWPFSGRRLLDDVGDITFTFFNNNQPLGDFVNRNDARFRDVFPFVGESIQPNPVGVDNPDDRTRL